MQLDRAAWEASRKGVNKLEERSRRVNEGLVLLQSAAVAAEHLTHQPEWDAFLRQAEALQERDRAQVTSLRSQIDAQHWLDAVDLMQLRYQLLFYQARIEGRAQVIEIPRGVMRAARAASQ